MENKDILNKTYTKPQLELHNYYNFSTNSNLIKAVDEDLDLSNELVSHPNVFVFTSPVYYFPEMDIYDRYTVSNSIFKDDMTSSKLWRDCYNYNNGIDCGEMSGFAPNSIIQAFIETLQKQKTTSSKDNIYVIMVKGIQDLTNNIKRSPAVMEDFVNKTVINAIKSEAIRNNHLPPPDYICVCFEKRHFGDETYSHWTSAIINMKDKQSCKYHNIYVLDSMGSPEIDNKEINSKKFANDCNECNNLQKKILKGKDPTISMKKDEKCDRIIDINYGIFTSNYAKAVYKSIGELFNNKFTECDIDIKPIIHKKQIQDYDTTSCGIFCVMNWILVLLTPEAQQMTFFNKLGNNTSMQPEEFEKLRIILFNNYKDD